MLSDLEENPARHSRRKFIAFAAFLVTLGMGGQVRAAGPVCYDPATLAFDQRNRRRGIGFIENSQDAKRRCGFCAFFTAGEGLCGTCQMLGGGPVTANGVCRSFAGKS